MVRPKPPLWLRLPHDVVDAASLAAHLRAYAAACVGDADDAPQRMLAHAACLLDDCMPGDAQCLRDVATACDAMALTAPPEAADEERRYWASVAHAVDRIADHVAVTSAADPEEPARERAVAWHRRLERVPALAEAEVAQRLGVGAADVRTMRAAGRLLAVDDEGGARYPSVQFTESGVLSGFQEVLEALTAVPIDSDWVRLDFLLAPDAHDDGRSVAELLRDGDLDEALAVVRRYGETSA